MNFKYIAKENGKPLISWTYPTKMTMQIKWRYFSSEYTSQITTKRDQLNYGFKINGEFKFIWYNEWDWAKTVTVSVKFFWLFNNNFMVETKRLIQTN